VTRLLPALLLVAAAPALAIAPLCEPELEPTRVILPCGVADNVITAGNASCADATFYIVTADGEVLCQIELPVLAPSTTTSIERAPGGLPSSSSSFGAAAHATDIGRLPLPCVVDLAAGGSSSASIPADGHARPPPVPS
jgi:hypothetical protein